MYKIKDLRNKVMESMVNRDNILCLLESNEPPEPYTLGYWKGYTITLPDGVELETKTGMKIAGRGYPTKVYNKDGQYSAVSLIGNEWRPVDLAYVLNESIYKTVDLVIYD